MNNRMVKIGFKSFSVPLTFALLILLCAFLDVIKLSKNQMNISEDILSADSPKHFDFKICYSQQLLTDKHTNQSNEMKTLFIITPTYTRREQVAELTSLAQVLRNAAAFEMNGKGFIHWIIVQDSDECDDFLKLRKFIEEHLSTSNITFSILSSEMPEKYRSPQSMKKIGLPRGVAGRNAALKWILMNTNPSYVGVIYFADDDNTYDVKVFSELLKTQRISMIPVGLIKPYNIRSPLVIEKNNIAKVIGFIGDETPHRKFPIDMAGFAFSVGILHEKMPRMPFKATLEEEGFLLSMDIEYSDIEPLASNCTQILVWHTQTLSDNQRPRFKANQKARGTNLESLLKNLANSGLATLDGFTRLPMCIGNRCQLFKIK